MSRLPAVTPRQVLAALLRAGFVTVRVRGSHHFLRHRNDASRSTVVAMHAGDIAQGTLRDILKQAALSKEEFFELL
jgi:predicted RNA binding protein YcfA (HicA-like mRNA interferase family)